MILITRCSTCNWILDKCDEYFTHESFLRISTSMLHKTFGRNIRHSLEKPWKVSHLTMKSNWKCWRRYFEMWMLLLLWLWKTQIFFMFSYFSYQRKQNKGTWINPLLFIFHSISSSSHFYRVCENTTNNHSEPDSFLFHVSKRIITLIMIAYIRKCYSTMCFRCSVTY